MSLALAAALAAVLVDLRLALFPEEPEEGLVLLAGTARIQTYGSGRMRLTAGLAEAGGASCPAPVERAAVIPLPLMAEGAALAAEAEV
jgi:hypothetical protein